MMYLNKDTKQKWGEGLDYLFVEYHDGIDRIVKNNLEEKYNHYLINGVALGMVRALEEAYQIFKEKWPEEKKLFEKIGQLQLLYCRSTTLNEEVVFITLAEQFLRSIY